MCASVGGALVETNAGDPATDIGAELDAQLTGIGIGVRARARAGCGRPKGARAARRDISRRVMDALLPLVPPGPVAVSRTV